MTDIPAQSARLLSLLREQQPLVHNITNYVSMDVAANALLAIGASPAMVHAQEEAAEFVSFSNALVINIGTLSAPWVESMVLAAKTARERSIPWVLDPVGAGATGMRNDAVAVLLKQQPTIIRGNASEILAVAGMAGARPKGVDSANSTEEAVQAAIALARRQSAVVVASGEIDFITDGQRQVRLGDGHVLMTKVTALGCALSAIVAAFAAIERDAFVAAAAAAAVYGVCGTLAAEKAEGPASFRTAFIDLLARVDPKTVEARATVVT